MSASRNDRLEAWFHRLASLAPEARAVELEPLRESEPDLAAEVESLLEAHDRAGVMDRLTDRIAPAPVDEIVPPAEFVGRSVGRFRIERLIARGGMGDVYAGRDQRLGRDVAMKFLPAWLSRDPSARDRFLVEARIVSSIDHPNVCTLLEIGETQDGRTFLVMPLYEGESLDRRLVRGPLDPREATALALQAARGLAAAHERGVVHRDVKPANLFITDEGPLKVLDFGVAKLADVTLTGPGQTPGTRRYMAPEQAAGHSVDARADLWSLGVVLREMVTGARPPLQWVGVQTGSTEDGTTTVTGRGATELPAGLERILARLLAADIDDRYPAASHVVEELSGFLAEPDDSAAWAVGDRSAPSTEDPRASVRGSGEGGRRRSRLVPGGVAAALAALGLLILGSWWSGRQARESADGAPADTDPRSGPVQPDGRVGVQARAYYERGRYQWNLRTEDGLRRALEHFEQAIALEPDYAAAWAGLSDTYNLLEQYRQLPPDSARPLALRAAERSLELDSTLAEAWTARAELHAMNREWTQAERMYRRAVDLDPKYATARHFYGWFLTHVGRHEAAIAQLEEASREAPVAAIIDGDLAHAYLNAGRYREADSLSRSTLEFMPSSLHSKVARVMLHQARGTAESTYPHPDSLPAFDDPLVEVYALGVIGRSERVDSIVDAQIDRAGGSAEVHPRAAFFMAAAYLALHDEEKGLDWLERAVTGGVSLGPFSLFGPVFDPVRDTPRFREIVRRMGLAEDRMRPPRI